MRFIWILLSCFLLGCLVSTVLIARFVIEPPKQGHFRCGMELIVYPACWFMIFLLSIFTLPILFNYKEEVRKNRVKSFLSFFGLPLLMTLFSLLFVDEVGIIILVVILPYLLLLGIHFWFYRKSIANQRY